MIGPSRTSWDVLALRGLAVCWLPLLALLLGSCASSPSLNWELKLTSTYDVLPRADRLRLIEARRDFEAGRSERAQVALENLVALYPGNLPSAIWLQETELATDEPEDLRRTYRERAEAQPTVTHLLLAARIESDTVAARALIGRAIELDPECAWAHYAVAHNAAVAGQWEQAQEALNQALKLDPGHGPARRLEAWFLSRGGRVEPAIAAIERWLDEASGDPRVPQAWLGPARLDLMLLYVMGGRPEEARRILDAVDSTLDPARRGALQAGLLQAEGDPKGALSAAEAAALHDPQALLPAVQRALLLEDWLGEEAAARSAWRTVVELAGESGKVSALFELARARVRLERLERTVEGGLEELQ